MCSAEVQRDWHWALLLVSLPDLKSDFWEPAGSASPYQGFTHDSCRPKSAVETVVPSGQTCPYQKRPCMSSAVAVFSNTTQHNIGRESKDGTEIPDVRA